MTTTTEVGAGDLADLVKQVQAGHEVLLTQSNKPAAKIVAVFETPVSPMAPLRVRSLKGHGVLTPTISQEDLAGELFGRS